MKIKTKKQLNLPQLIEWAWGNDVKDLSFRGHDKKGYVVSISINDKGEFTSDWRISKNDLFTIEVEEEITEDTEFDDLYKMNSYKGALKSDQSTIAQDLEISVLEPISYYMLNNDLTMTLIWRDGKLVE